MKRTTIQEHDTLTYFDQEFYVEFDFTKEQKGFKWISIGNPGCPDWPAFFTITDVQLNGHSIIKWMNDEAITKLETKLLEDYESNRY